jgi:hypothetical protein
MVPSRESDNAFERLHILAQGGDFERPPGGNDRHSAVLDTGRHRLEACRLDPADHLARQRGGGDVSIAVWLAEQRVAHCAADDASLLAFTVKRGEDVAQWRLTQPSGIQPALCLRHFVPPGTKRPSSVWAGT